MPLRIKWFSFGRLVTCLVLVFAIVRFGNVILSEFPSATKGDFYMTLPGGYAETLNPTLWNSPELVIPRMEVRQYFPESERDTARTYLHGPTQFLTLYPIVFLDSYAEIARLILVVYVALILFACWVISKSFDFVAEGDPVTRRLLIYGSTLLFYPLLQSLMQREFEVVILLALALTFWAAIYHRHIVLGGLMAYITWYKFLPVVFLPYLIARRWWKSIVAFTALSLVIIGLSEWLFGGISLFFNNHHFDSAATNQLTELASPAAFCSNWAQVDSAGTFASVRWGLCGLQARGYWIPLPFSYFALGGLTAFFGGLGFWGFEQNKQPSLETERWRRVWELSLVVLIYSTFFRGHYYYLSALTIPLIALLVRATSDAPIQKIRLALAVLAYALLGVFVLPISVLSAVFEVDVWRFYLEHQLYLLGEVLLLGLVLHEYVKLSFQVTPSEDRQVPATAEAHQT